MTKSVHMTVGVSTMLLLSVAHPSGFEVLNTKVLPALALVTAAIGSYIPDFDTKPMHYTQGKKGVSKAAASVASKAVNKATGGHRGITHTLLFPVLIYALMWYVDSSFHRARSFSSMMVSFLFGFLVGWVLHIFADLFNGKGVPLFWPLIRSKVHIADFPSEGIGQWLWCGIYMVVAFMVILGKEIL